MAIRAWTKPTSIPIRHASRILTAKIIFESAKLSKARNAKAARTKNKVLLYATGGKKKLMARLPAIITARYAPSLHDASILSFRNMLYPTARAKASITAYTQTT